MEVTTVTYYCDMCGAEMKAPMNKTIVNSIDKQFGYGDGTLRDRIAHRVTIEFYQDGKVEYQQSQLCRKCQIEILKGILKKLEKKEN